MGVNSKRAASAVSLDDLAPAAELLRSFSNPQRLMIACTLVEGERAVSDLERELAIKQPSLSQHLASLREAGIIRGRREAKAVYYRISDERAALLVDALHAIFCGPSRRGREGAHAAVSEPKRTAPLVTNTAPSRGRRPSEAAFFARVGEIDNV